MPITSIDQNGKQAWPIYFGGLTVSKMSTLENKAYRIYTGQKTRCLNKKDKQYHTYGGRGISVEYSVREFIGWFCMNRPMFSGDKADVGRIDHSKNYLFENIRIESHSENTRESAIRNRLGKRLSQQIKATDSNGVIKLFSSMLDAANYFGCSKSLINAFLKGQNKTSKKITMTLELNK